MLADHIHLSSELAMTNIRRTQAYTGVQDYTNNESKGKRVRGSTTRYDDSICPRRPSLNKKDMPMEEKEE